MSGQTAEAPHRALGLTDSEYDLIVEKLGREPNATELAMFSLMWSEHCSYKHSKQILSMLPTEGPHLDPVRSADPERTAEAPTAPTRLVRARVGPVLLRSGIAPRAPAPGERAGAEGDRAGSPPVQPDEIESMWRAGGPGRDVTRREPTARAERGARGQHEEEQGEDE